MMYEDFATVYDALMADVDYERWASYYLALSQRSGVVPKRAAECACGTGSLTLALAARGVVMTGLDRSADMLRVAGDKARGKGKMLPFIQQDMRKLQLHRQMDAIFCGCDGVNYLLNAQDVQAFFTSAYQAIRPGGGLFFDVSTEHKLAHTLGNSCLCDDGEAVSYIWQNHYDRAMRTVQMDLAFFVRDEDGRYARFDETHLQRAHTVEELTKWLQDAGFTGIVVYGDQHFDAPRADTERIHVAAIRPDLEA